MVLAVISWGMLTAGAVQSGLAAPGSGDETGGAALIVAGLAVAVGAAWDATTKDGRPAMLWRSRRRAHERV